MTTGSHYVVRLRGVNAGPKNRIAMPELRSALADAGCADVQTVAQSGNVVVTYRGTAADVERVVRRVVASRFDLDVDVIVRDADALLAVVADNPLREIATDASRHFVVFCSEPHDPSLLPEVVAPERLVCRPSELHAWCPDGVRDGRLMTALGRRPPAPITSFRNWNTITRLADLLERRATRP